MSKLTFPLSIAALAVLGACATYEPATPAPVVVTTPAPVVTTPAPGTVVVPQVAQGTTTVMQLRAGSGRVESISAVPSITATAGSSAQASRRLGLRMDDGTMQYVDTDAQGINLGDRVQLTGDGYIRRP
jgi:hypothetical protein